MTGGLGPTTTWSCDSRLFLHLLGFSFRQGVETENLESGLLRSNLDSSNDLRGYLKINANTRRCVLSIYAKAIPDAIQAVLAITV